MAEEKRLEEIQKEIEELKEGLEDLLDTDLEDVKELVDVDEDMEEDMDDEGFSFNLSIEDPEMEEDSIVGKPIHLVLDDGAEMDTIVIAAFPVEPYPWQYIALLPVDEDIPEEDAEVFLYRIEIDEDGAPVLGAIESDEEYEAVADVFYQEMEALEAEAAAFEE